MPKVKISEYSATANSNTDVASINIDEGCAPSGINNAIRAIMGHLKDFQSGTSNDPFTVGSSGSLTLSYGTANGVAYLNGSKVLTTGSALVFDGTNLGLGVTPSAWQSGFKAIQLSGLACWNVDGAVAGSATYFGNNVYRDSVDSRWEYIASSDNATQYLQASGQHIWRTAPSGTAGNQISFTQAMTLDASGNLGVGTTSPSARLDVVTASGSTYINARRNSQSTGEVGLNLYGGTSGQNWGIYIPQSSNDLRFYTSGSDRVTIDSSGNLGIGTTSPAYKLDVVSTSMRIASGSTGVGYVQYGNSSTASNNWHVGTEGDGTYRFYNGNFGSGTERARIDSSGNLLVGTTSTSVTSGGLVFQPAAGQSYGDWGHVTGTSSGSYYLALRYNGTIIGGITQNGTTAVAYNTTSDYRLKENVQPLSGALARIASLKPCTYTWKSAPDEVGEGFIAHELAEVCPQAVTGEKDAVDEDGNPVYQGIDTSFLVATLTAAIKEQQAIIQSLTARITALEGA